MQNGKKFKPGNFSGGGIGGSGSSGSGGKTKMARITIGSVQFSDLSQVLTNINDIYSRSRCARNSARRSN
jgi:hypothetical protein